MLHRESFDADSKLGIVFGLDPHSDWMQKPFLTNLKHSVRRAGEELSSKPIVPGMSPELVVPNVE